MPHETEYFLENIVGVWKVKQDIPIHLVEAARGYESLFVPALFEPWTKHLVDSANIQEGFTVLDVACGTGVLARHALAYAGKSGLVVGADPAPGMLAVASEIEPAIQWISCSAEALDFSDCAFDCVLSQFGMMFFEDRKKAAEEMFRVLKAGGSLVIAVWRSIEHNPAYSIIISILEQHVGKDAADALRLPFSLSDSDEVVSTLKDVGFTEIEVEVKEETATFASSRQMVEAELRGWLPLFDILLTEGQIHKVLSESDKTLARFSQVSGQAIFPTSANIFAARKI